MSSPIDITKTLAHLEDELNSVALYRALAESEKDARLAEVYRRLANTEQGHADTWAEKLKSSRVNIPPFKPTWRTRTLIWMARRFGAQAVLPSASSAETVKSQDYSGLAETRKMVESRKPVSSQEDSNKSS